jgi:hypothetical protein
MVAVRAEKERLNHILGSHLTTIHETLQVLDQTPSFDAKVTWEYVIKMSEQVSKQATTGLLFPSDSVVFFFLLEIVVREDSVVHICSYVFMKLRKCLYNHIN